MSPKRLALFSVGPIPKTSCPNSAEPRVDAPAIQTLTTALPATDPELIGGIFANLLDLWETGQKLDKELQKLKKLRLPKDRETLRSTLQWIDAIQLDMASYWIDEIKKYLPKLLKALDKLERRSVHGRARTAQRSSARRAK